MKRTPLNNERKAVIDKIFELITREPDLIFNFEGQTACNNDNNFAHKDAEAFAKSVIDRFNRIDFSAKRINYRSCGENKHLMPQSRKMVLKANRN